MFLAVSLWGDSNIPLGLVRADSIVCDYSMTIARQDITRFWRPLRRQRSLDRQRHRSQKGFYGRYTGTYRLPVCSAATGKELTGYIGKVVEPGVHQNVRNSVWRIANHIPCVGPDAQMSTPPSNILYLPASPNITLYPFPLSCRILGSGQVTGSVL